MKRVNLCALLVIILVSTCYASGTIFLIQPKHIKNFSDIMFVCYSRGWWMDKELQPKMINNVIYLNYAGGRKWKGRFIYPTITTFPEEVNQPPIIIINKKQLVIEFEKKMETKLIIKSEITTNDFKMFYEDIDCFKKSSVSIKLPQGTKSINYLKLIFTGENSLIGIKSLFIK